VKQISTAVIKMLLRQCYTKNNELSQSKTVLDTQHQQYKEHSYEITKYRIKAMP